MIARIALREQPVFRWEVRQIFDDRADDHDRGISAIVDLAASDAAGMAVVHVIDVNRLG